uniref:Ovule protein n=1 Tax=Rodentolepis nana TaxID=102285 RepID=A0A158QHB3_RODNA
LQYFDVITKSLLFEEFGSSATNCSLRQGRSSPEVRRTFKGREDCKMRVLITPCRVSLRADHEHIGYRV